MAKVAQQTTKQEPIADPVPGEDAASLNPSAPSKESGWEGQIAFVIRGMAAHAYARALVLGRRELLGPELAGPGHYNFKVELVQSGGFPTKQEQAEATKTLTEKLSSLAEQAGISRFHHEELVYQFMRPEFFAPRSFVLNLAKWDPKSLEETLLDLLEPRDPKTSDTQKIIAEDRRKFLLSLAEQNPVVGIVTLCFQSQLRAGFETKDLDGVSGISPVRGWYLNGIDTAVKAQTNIDGTFDNFERRINRWQTQRMTEAKTDTKRSEIARDAEQVKELLSLWKEDIRSVLLEATMMLGVFALQSEWLQVQCPVLSYWPKFPAQRASPEALAALDTLQNKFDFMKEALPHLFDKTKMNGAATVPMPITIFDAPFFIEYIGNYFGELNSELEEAEDSKSGAKKRAMRSDAESSTIRLNKFVIKCHPKCTEEHEARIAITSDTSDLCLRIDYDRRGRVGFDVGAIDLERALHVAYYELSPANLPNYRDLVDEKGDFRQNRAARQSRTSALERFKGLTDGERVSLLFSSFATCGFSMGTRREIPVSHHNRERICDNWSPEDFARIVTSLAKALGA